MNKPIRVLHVLGGLGLGGAETFVMNLYRTIDRNEFQFDFVIYDDGLRDYEKEIVQLGGRVFLSPHFTIRKAHKYIIWWKMFLKEHPEYQIIHGHLRSTATIYLREAKKEKRYTIAHSHNTSSGKGISAMIKNLMQFPIRFIADEFVGCSEKANEWLFGKKITYSNRCKVVRNSIPLEKYKFDWDIRESVRKALNISDDCLVIGNIGRMVFQKNQELILRVFCEVQREHPKAKLLIIGKGVLEEHLKQKAVDLGIQDKVVFMGNRHDVEKILNAMDVFLFPSHYEGLGIVAVEAQANSLPVVCSSAIPKEAAISNKIYYKRLEDSLESWSETVLKEAYRYKRGEVVFNELYSEYEIVNTVAVVKNIYYKGLSAEKKEAI